VHSACGQDDLDQLPLMGFYTTCSAKAQRVIAKLLLCCYAQTWIFFEQEKGD